MIYQKFRQKNCQKFQQNFIKNMSKNSSKNSLKKSLRILKLCLSDKWTVSLIILGAPDAWLMSCLSHRPSEPVYYIEDYRILYTGSQKPLEGPEFELLTLDQQMVPQYSSIWRGAGDLR